MEKHKVTAPPPEAAERDDVHVVANRCPYCHDAVVVSASDWSSCRGCQARHHEACWDEAGACASCGGTARLVAEGRSSIGPALTGVGFAASVMGFLSGAMTSPLDMLRFSGAIGLLTVLFGCYLVVRCARQVRRRASGRELERSAGLGLALLGLGLLGTILGGLGIWDTISRSPVSPTPEQLAAGAEQMWATIQLAGVCAAPSFLLLMLGFRRSR